MPFTYRDLGSVATIGRFRAIASVRKVRLSGFPAWVVWFFVHLAFLTGFGEPLHDDAAVAPLDDRPRAAPSGSSAPPTPAATSAFRRIRARDRRPAPFPSGRPRPRRPPRERCRESSSAGHAVGPSTNEEVAMNGTQEQSAAMSSPFPPIADYGFLSDCHTGALVAPDGGCRLAVRPPLRLSECLRQPARPRGGHVPLRSVRHQRPDPAGATRPGTNVLVTTWKTPSGWVVVRDALIIGPTRGPDTVTPHDPAPGRRRRRAPPRADGRVPRWPRRDGARVRARLRLRHDRGQWALMDDDAATRPTRPAPG